MLAAYQDFVACFSREWTHIRRTSFIYVSAHALVLAASLQASAAV